jgi:hypothetical protein
MDDGPCKEKLRQDGRRAVKIYSSGEIYEQRLLKSRWQLSYF